jgi:catechol 2,3-dioxygenase-like lactoylglutathione lyase family enzyme
VPFFAVSDMTASTRFYVDGLGFEITQKWVDDGKLRWCWLQRNGAAIMLQEFRTEWHDAWIPQYKVGEGVSTYFICKNALAIFHKVITRGVQASTPFVGNSMWITGMKDPDGYQLYFESYTDVPEETVYKVNIN